VGGGLEVSLFRFDRAFHLADKIRTLRDNTEIVHLWVAREVVHFDVIHVGGLLDALDLPNVAAVAEDVGVLADEARVALEVDGVNLVVPDQRLEQADVR